LRTIIGVVIAVIIAVIVIVGISTISENVNIIPYDCAKGWDELRDHAWLRNSDEFKKLGFDEKYPIRKDEVMKTYEFNKNLCYANHEKWEQRSQDKDGKLEQINSGYQGLSWRDSILAEMDYNLKFPNGHWQE